MSVQSYFNDREPADFSGFDFNHALKLPRHSETYEFYISEINHRRIFVKRLKDSYRDKPFYRAALAKEFEIGRRLNHPSLPIYLYAGDDFVVTTYIEGKTLAEALRDKDRWLRNDRNVKKFFRQLIEVIGYLHRYNIIHCDIKPDNIIVTEKSGNIVLLDFDKCYTDSLASTSGQPAVYGIDSNQTGNPSIDYHGVGMIIDRLKRELPGFKHSEYRRMRELCFGDDVSNDRVLSSIDLRVTIPRFVYIICVAALILLGLVIYFYGSPRHSQQTPTTQVADIAVAPVDSSTAIVTDTIIPTNEPRREKTSVNISVFDDVIQTHLSPLIPYMVSTEALIDSNNDIPQELRQEKVTEMAEMLHGFREEAANELRQKFPYLSKAEADSLTKTSAVYIRFNDEVQRVSRLLNDTVSGKQQ